MTATDELRRLLDERGVESWDMQTRGLWFGITGNDHKYEAHEQRDGLLLVEAMSLTPEQAIAATLGSEREKQLELLVNQLWYLVNHQSGYGYAAALEAIEELGIEVGE